MEPRTYDIGDSVELRAWSLTAVTRGTVQTGKTALTVHDASGYVSGNPIVVVGAGAGGSDLVTTVGAVAGKVVTLADAASEDVTDALVGKPTNATVVCRVRKPSGDLVAPAPAVSPVSTGLYKAVVDPDAAGDWWYGFDVTGAVKAAGERKFLVRERRA